MNKIDVELILDDVKYMPERKSVYAAGYDIRARTPHDITVQPGQVSPAIGTGVRVNMPNDVALFLHARSGLAFEDLTTLINGTGVIDADYHGELMLKFHNVSGEPITIKNEDRLAQGVFQPYLVANFIIVDEFSEKSERGEAGLGSSGRS